MKLFLTSHYLNDKHFNAFRDLMGKHKALKALFITTASVPYGYEPKPQWLTESLDDMSILTENYDETTLEKEDFIPDDLGQYDFIFVAGGNSFYLAYRLAETGMDKKIKKYIADDGIYSGSSAGAVVLMENIEYFAPADDLSKSPRVYPGLGIISGAVIPHVDSKKYADIMQDIADKYKREGKEIFLLNDNQVLIIDSDRKNIL
ncbi:MAG: Type 1 glutamine amidotransferase-like domain-containing protein [Candidatus Moraniibacteriota bacterium]